MSLILSETEYALVCLVLEEPPMALPALTELARVRLFLSRRETEGLLRALLERGVLTKEDGRITSSVTREEAELSAIARVLDPAVSLPPAPRTPS